MPYLSASEVLIHYEEALYQLYAPLQNLEDNSAMSLLGKSAGCELVECLIDVWAGVEWSKLLTMPLTSGIDISVLAFEIEKGISNIHGMCHKLVKFLLTVIN